jgi:hypothetical protein
VVQRVSINSAHGSKNIQTHEAITVHGLDVRLGQDVLPLMLRTQNCLFLTEASASQLGLISVKPLTKVCDNIETKLDAQPILVKSKVINNALTGERINTDVITARLGKPIDQLIAAARKRAIEENAA